MSFFICLGARVFNIIARIYLSIDDYQKSLDWLNKELEIYNDFDDEFKGLIEQKAKIYNQMGLAFLNKDDFDKAIEYFHISLN